MSDAVAIVASRAPGRYWVVSRREMRTPSTLGRCPRCSAWVSDLGRMVGSWSGSAANPGGAVYQTRCFGCQSTLRAFDDVSGDERRIDEELTAADLLWEVVDEKKKSNG